MEEERRILTINKPDGTTETVEEVISFEFGDTKRKYCVYTKNEMDNEGNVTIYVTEIVKDNEGFKFLGVESDAEWSRIKDALRKLIKNEK